MSYTGTLISGGKLEIVDLGESCKARCPLLPYEKCFHYRITWMQSKSHLQPVLTKIPNYLRDTTDFLCQLQDIPPLGEEPLLVTMDVSSRYTSITHDEGTQAIKKILSQTESTKELCEPMCRLIEFILTHNVTLTVTRCSYL